MWIAVLTVFWWLSSTARAIENIECEYDLSGDHEVALTSQLKLTLGRGDVLVRGTLSARRHGHSPRIDYGVRDDFDVARVYRDPKDGFFKFSPGDLIVFLSDDRRRSLGRAYYGQTIVPPTSHLNADARSGRVPRPLFMRGRYHQQSALNPEQIDRIFRMNVPVIVIKSLNRSEYDDLRARLSPDIAAFEGHRTRATRWYFVTEGEQFELAHFDRPFSGTFTYDMVAKRQPRLDLGHGRVLPESLVYRFSLNLKDNEGVTTEARDGDYVYLIDRADRVLMKFHLEAADIIMNHPFTEFDQQLCAALAFAKRMVIIRPE